MADWRDPAAGYNTFAGSQSDLMLTKQAYDDITLVADSASSTIAAAWHAPASQAMQARLLAFRNTIPEIQNVLLTARQAVVAYKTALDTIRSAQDTWLTQYNNANHQLSNLHVRNPLLDPVGAAEDLAEQARYRTLRVEAMLRLQQLYGRRREADATVIAALNSATPRSWADTRSAFAAAGITQETLLSSSKSKEAMLDLARRMIDGDMSDENVAALSGLLSVWGNSQTTMSSFFARFGGANTAQLIDRLAEKMSFTSGAYGELEDSDYAILTLANRIRSGLSLGAQDWGQEFSNGFMRDMLTGASDYWDNRLVNAGGDPAAYSARIQAVAFLFADPDGSPMPEKLAFGAALMVDELENKDHPNSSNLVNWVNPEVAVGAGVFGMYTPEGVYTGEMSQMDLAGRVFETLGLYPESSLEFLMGGDDRIEYWFGERDWSYGDGFAGPGALWLGAAQVEGADSASVASEIMWELFENEYLVSENVTGEGAAYLAGAISIDLAGMVEFATTNGTDDVPRNASELVTLLGAANPSVTPTVSTDVLAVLLGVAGVHPEGAMILQHTADQWQQAYFAYGMSDPSAFMEAVRLSSTLQGVIDGSGIGETLAAAERSDIRREETVEAIMTLIGLVPVPGLSQVFSGGGKIVFEYGTEILVDSLGDIALAVGLDSIAGLAIGGTADYNAALISTGLTETALAHAREFANGANLYSFIAASGGDISGIEAPPVRQPGETAEAFVVRADAWYSAAEPALNAAGASALGNEYFELDKILEPYKTQVDSSAWKINR